MKMKTLSTLAIAVVLVGLMASGANAATLYGTEWRTGDIFSIDTNLNTTTLLLDISTAPVSPAISPIDSSSPNGNAFDAINQRFYFTSFVTPGTPFPPLNVTGSKLYFVDLDDAPGTIVWAGTLQGAAPAGTFYDGKYWYIGHGTDELQEVTLNADGTIASETTAAVDISAGVGPDTGFLSFGDIAFDCYGRLFLSGLFRNVSNGNVGTLTGTYNLETSQFNEFTDKYAWQIAFGEDENLYGHSTGEGKFYSIDTTTGTPTWLFDGRSFSDLAGNLICEIDPGCTLTQGYWKTHSSYGPAPYDSTWAMLIEGADTSFFGTGLSYYEVLNTPPKGGNAYYILAHQYIAAELNQLSGATIPPEVLDAFNEATSLLGSYGGTQSIPKRSADRFLAVGLADSLGEYNAGLVGPGHCPELDEPDLGEPVSSE